MVQEHLGLLRWTREKYILPSQGTTIHKTCLKLSMISGDYYLMHEVKCIVGRSDDFNSSVYVCGLNGHDSSFNN